MNEPYGFIYITTNLINGKKYLGQKKFDNRWKSYLGSGKALKIAVEKYGKENFTRDIIKICYSAEELNKAERDLSIEYNVVESKEWYNEVYGGGSMSGYKVSDISKRKNSLSHLGKKVSEETRKKISEAGKQRFSNPQNNPMFGKKHSAETKRRMSEARQGKFAGAKSSCSFGVSCKFQNGEILLFGSTKEAEREMGVDRCTIKYHIDNGKPDKKGRIWYYTKSASRIGG